MRGSLAAGRRSASIVGSAAVLAAPVEPYRIGRPYHRRGAGLLEIPIGVTARGRLPFLGTALSLAGPRASRWIASGMARRGFASLELHAIDLCDATDAGLGPLAARQTDLRVSRVRKERSLRGAIEVLRDQGRRFTTLAEVAERDHTVAPV